MTPPDRPAPFSPVRRRWVAYLDAGSASARHRRRIFSVVEEYTPEVEWLGGGRFYLDFSSTVRLSGHPLDSLVRLGRRLLRGGFACSAGLSLNKFLSRSAAVRAGEGGAFWIPAGREGDFLEEMPMGLWPGLREEEVRFWRSLGVERAADLARVDLFWVRRAAGVRGVVMSGRARGFDPRPVIRRPPGEAGIREPFGLFPPAFKDEKLQRLARLAGSLRERYGRRVFPFPAAL